MKFNNTIMICLVAALAGFTTTAQAATKTNKVPKSAITSIASSVNEPISNLPDQAQLDAYTKEIESRHPASSGVTPSEDMMSSKMKAFRDAFIAARKGEDINRLFKKLDADYAAFEKSPEFKDEQYNDYRYFGARVLPFRKMAGYAWRMIPAVEEGKIRASQEVMLATIRSMAEEIKIHAPDSHNEAIFRFLTEPQEGISKRFYTEADVQDFYVGEMVPAIAIAFKRIQNLKLTNPIVLDERLRFGDVSFPDSNEKRFRLIGEAEKAGILARMARRMASILVFTSYDFTDYLKIRRDMGKKQGIDVMFASQIGGLTREERAKIMHDYPAFGVKRSYGNETMKDAYSYLYLEAYYLTAGYRVLKDEDGSNDNWLLEPEMVVSTRKKVEEKSLKSMLAMTKAALNTTEEPNKFPEIVPLKSSLSGETINVDLKAYFYNSPNNLQDLLPTEFDKGPSYFADKPYCKGCKYRNYFQGRAIGWNVSSYRALFPDLKDGKEVAHYQDVLSEARGGRLTANFLAPMVR